MDELERHLIAAYFNYVNNNKEKKSVFMGEDDNEQFTILVAKGCIKWLDDRQTVTTDEVFRMVMQ
eukprot:14803232-Ditylum_brightwellii.AAC.1